MDKNTIQLLINKISNKIDSDQKIIKKRGTAGPLLGAFDMGYKEGCVSCIGILQDILYPEK